MGRLAILQEVRRHAAIWKALNNLLVENWRKERGREGGREGTRDVERGSKKRGGGDGEDEEQNP